MSDGPLLSKAMQSRLALLKGYLADESLTRSVRDEVCERVVRLILGSLKDETEQGRGMVLDYLRLLGFGYLIEEQP